MPHASHRHAAIVDTLESDRFAGARFTAAYR
jgi:hypothetical protein